VSDDAPQGPPPPAEVSPEDLARLLATAVPPSVAPGRSALRRKLLGAILVAGIGLGASIMSCVGQSFSLRQARALEGIEQQIKQIRMGCIASPPTSGAHQ
jgi:hypothetical protein